MPNGLPYARLSAFYGLYFATLGLLLPFWSVYLDTVGYSASRIGVLLGAMLGMKIIAPYVWGALADHLGRRIGVIRLATLAGGLCFFVVPLADGFWLLLAVIIVFAFFWNACIPQFEVITFNYLAEQSDRYGRIRVWGSVGFIIAALGLGALVERLGVWLLPYAVGMTMVVLTLVATSVREPPAAGASEDSGPIGATLRQPVVYGLLAACALMQFSHGPYYGFYSLYVESYGYGESLIGGLWALGVAAEVFAFLLVPAGLRRFGPRPLLMLAMGVAALRWTLLALVPDSLPMLLFIQTLHMASFGVYHAVGVYLIHHLFRGRQQGRGQALYSAVSFGAGGALGSLVGGLVWDHAPREALFLVSAAGALAGLAVTWLFVRGPATARSNAVPA